MNLPQPVLTFVSKAALRMPPVGKPVVRAVLSLINMPLTARFVDYVIDFERAYKNDDWSRVEGYFSADAVYEVRNTDFACRLEGARNIVNGFKHSLDGFDRRLKRSIGVTEGPHEKDGQVTFVWVARYEAPDHPPLIVSARQTAHYRDGLVSLLIDDYLPGHGQIIADWIKNQGQGLNPAYE